MRNQTPGNPGIEFTETLSGGFSLGAHDAELGYIAGRLARTELSIHCTIRIPDVAAFALDPDHVAELDVVLDFSPLGEGIRARPGTFQLFAPDETGDTRLMIYRFDFDWQGETYAFEGKKYMHEGASFFSLWNEGTHLHSYIYRRGPGARSNGEPSKDPIVGAGILGIGVRGVFDLLRSMRVTDASSALETASASARLGKFFASEIWDLHHGHSHAA